MSANSTTPATTLPPYLYALGQMRAGSVLWQRPAALAAELIVLHVDAVLKVRPLLAVTPVGSCLSQLRLLAPSGAAEGVITLTKSARTYTAQHSTPQHMQL